MSAELYVCVRRFSIATSKTITKEIRITVNSKNAASHVTVNLQKGEFIIIPNAVDTAIRIPYIKIVTGPSPYRYSYIINTLPSRPYFKAAISFISEFKHTGTTHQ